jgi:DNA-binding response OmpR family regulator
MDGFEVLENLKRNSDPAVKATPVIILSNFGQEEKVERGLSLGAVDYLVKANFTTGEIVEKIKQVLKK